jgi:hypothetical protein
MRTKYARFINSIYADWLDFCTARGKTMLSFELSAVDIALLVAVIILFVLHLAGRPEASRKESRLELSAEKKRKPLLVKKEADNIQKSETTSSRQPNVGSQNCAHEFGYLKDLPRNTPVPNECFGCPRVMQCLFPSE